MTMKNLLNVACCTVWRNFRTDRFPAGFFHFCVIKGNSWTVAGDCIVFYDLINQHIMVALGYNSVSTQDVSFKELLRISYKLESITPVILLHCSLRSCGEKEERMRG